MPRFKPGDVVTCSECHELQQPLTVVGLNPWYDSHRPPYVYHVKGVHKRGNELTISLTEGILEPA